MEGEEQTDCKGSFINEGDLYTVAEFQRRMAFSTPKLRALRRQGLPVIRIGKRPFFSGRQVIAFMEGLSGAEN